MDRICPSCLKPLLSGFSPLCNHCGFALPPHLLFSADEKGKIEAEELRSRQVIEQLESERKKKAEAAGRAAIAASLLIR
jgi:hypothetical protein